jgi:hypothetical protein
VLRIDRYLDAGSELPSAEGLRMAFTQDLRNLAVQDARVVQGPDFGSVVLTLAPPLARDAGVQALVAAKQVNGDLFLCITEPGTSPAEVTKAEGVCASITEQTTPP